jgi:microcystin-dependent protein
MSEPFIGEIRMFTGHDAPPGWAFCDGQLIDINVYNALYTVIGTTYGPIAYGPPVKPNGPPVPISFTLPNFQGRAPMQPGAGGGLTPRRLGQTGGAETVGLGTYQIPLHRHPMLATGFPASNNDPTSTQYLAKAADNNLAYAPYPDLPAHPWALGNALTSTGGDENHPNMQPFLVLTFIIALEGEYPSRS